MGLTDGEQRIFRVLSLFCMIMQWWIRDLVCLSKPAERTTQRSKYYILNVNYELWLIII